MKALVTGASSGIGRDIAIYLSNLGYDIIAVARTEKNLFELRSVIKTDLKIISLDLSTTENVKELYNMTKDDQIDILVNNAGFGDLGFFTETNLEKEISLINTNITALHILTKLFLIDMKKRDKGYILNVGSIAGFMPGPLMATYYASKAYVLRLTQAVQMELKKTNPNVHISVLCPGPVKTNFNNVANADFKTKYLSSGYVAKYAIDNMFKNKKIIIPGTGIKIAAFFSRFMPYSLIMNVVYNLQRKKR